MNRFRSLLINSIRAAICAVGLLLSFQATPASAAAPDSTDFFESKIRPVLVEQCYKCHSMESGKKLKAGLFLDSREGMLKGGESGAAVVPGKPEQSLLIKAIQHTPGEDLQMPPKTRLP